MKYSLSDHREPIEKVGRASLTAFLSEDLQKRIYSPVWAHLIDIYLRGLLSPTPSLLSAISSSMTLKEVLSL